MRSARILVVDDDLWIQRTTASVLGQQGHQVSLAGDAHSAFALASRIRPDVVVTTVSLPALDGWSWWERLRALPASAHTPLIFLIPPGDVNSLTEATLGLVKNPERRRTMGAAARRVAGFEKRRELRFGVAGRQASNAFV